MEDELRLALLFAGTCFIVAILAHGMWKIRKSNSASPKPRREPRSWDNEIEDEELDGDDVAWDEQDMGQKSATRRPPTSDSENDFDDFGVGKVRVIHSSKPSSSQPKPSTEGEEKEAALSAPDQHADEPAQKASASEPQKLYGSVVTNPKPHMQSGRASGESAGESDVPKPPGFLLKEQSPASQSEEHPQAPEAETQTDPEIDDFSLDTPPSSALEQEEAQDEKNGASLGDHARRLVSRKRSKSAHKRRQEPSFGDDQMRIDFDQPKSSAQPAAASPEKKSETAENSAAEQEVLVLNVRAPDEDPISGAALLPLLLTLGFKFGDQDIFHRHVNSNGKGPVLFSLANMFKPGVFDIDNLETFTTQGVSLFMILPIEGDAHQVFNMMHNAARKIADEFHAQVLDGRRSVLTKQGLQQYIEKIREFERQRMIGR